MGMCQKNKANTPSKRASAAIIEAPKTEPVAPAATEEQQPALEPEPEACEQAAPSQCPESNRNTEKDEGEATDALAGVNAERGVDTDAVHGNAPPTHHDSTTTSCAGMTDADYLSRGGTLQQEINLKEEEQPVSPPAADAAEHSSKPAKDRECSQTKENEQQQPPPAQAEERQPSAVEEEDNERTAATNNQTNQEREEKKNNVSSDAPQTPEDARKEFASRAQETFESFKRSLSRGYDRLRSAHVSNSFRRVATGDFTELAAAEEFMCGLFNKAIALGELAVPCLADNSEEFYENFLPPAMPQIVMAVDTPGGPYVRRIPNELVGDAINMGFITEEEVQRQREEWEKDFGFLPIEYTPVHSLPEPHAAKA